MKKRYNFGAKYFEALHARKNQVGKPRSRQLTTYEKFAWSNGFLRTLLEDLEKEV